jgi:hypothetical protein
MFTNDTAKGLEYTADAPEESLQTLALPAANEWALANQIALLLLNRRPWLRRSLVGYVGRKVVKQYSKQSQPRNAVRGKNPDTTAFPVRSRRLRTRSSSRGTTSGSLFHINLQGREYGGAACATLSTLPIGACGVANITTDAGVLEVAKYLTCKIYVIFGVHRVAAPISGRNCGGLLTSHPMKYQFGNFSTDCYRIRFLFA